MNAGTKDRFGLLMVAASRGYEGRCLGLGSCRVPSFNGLVQLGLERRNLVAVRFVGSLAAHPRPVRFLGFHKSGFDGLLIVLVFFGADVMEIHWPWKSLILPHQEPAPCDPARDNAVSLSGHSDWLEGF